MVNIRKENGNIKVILIVVVLIIICILGIVLLKREKESENTYTSEVSKNEMCEYFALYSVKEKTGVVDKKGNIIIEPKYDQIYVPNKQKDVFICFSDDKYSILDKNNRELFNEFEEISVAMISEDLLEMEKDVLIYKSGNNYGLIDLEGNKLTEPIYTSIESLSNKPGNLLVEKDGNYGVLGVDGKEILPIKYSRITGDGYCSEEDGYSKTGYILSEKTKTGVLFGYANYKGKVLVEPKYEAISRLFEYEDEDIYLTVMENGKKGVLKNKKQIIKNKFQNINYYDTSNIFIVNKNGKYGFYNQEGKEILEPKYTTYSLAGNYIFVKTDEETGLYDIHGNLVNSNNYKSIIETDNPAFFIAENEKGYYSIISKDIEIEDKYTDISYAFDNFFIFTNEEGKYGVLNIYTGIEVEPEYDSILLTGNVKALEARKGNVVDIYSKKIEKVLTMNDGIVENIGNDFLVVHSNTEMQYLDKDGELTENTNVYKDLKLYSIQKDNKWGFSNSAGEIVVECEYDIVTELNEYGFAGICKDGKWGVIDSDGKIVEKPIHKIETYYTPQFIGKYQLDKLGDIHCIENE